MYHHFDPPYRDARSHDPEGITILCGTHAREADSGIRSVDSIREYNADPFCLREKYTIHMLDGRRGPLDFKLGPVTLNSPIVLMYEKEELISFKPPDIPGAPWRFNAIVFDRNGRELMKVVDNEWKIGSDRYDIEVAGQHFIVRDKLRDIILKMALEVDRLIHIQQLQMDCYGVNLKCDASSLCIKGKNGGTNCFKGSITGDIGIHILQSENIAKIATSLNPGSSAGVAFHI
jgi:hypothetical protein